MTACPHILVDLDHPEEPVWCAKCVQQLLDENNRLKARIAGLENAQSRQAYNRRLDYEDGLPWQDDDR